MRRLSADWKAESSKLSKSKSIALLQIAIDSGEIRTLLLYESENE